MKNILSHFEFTAELNNKVWGLGIISTSHYPKKSGHISIHIFPLILTVIVCARKDK